MKIHVELRIVLVALCSIITCGVAFAKDTKSATADYPAKAVHLIVPYPAGEALIIGRGSLRPDWPSS
jgi:hypothetical protein